MQTVSVWKSLKFIVWVRVKRTSKSSREDKTEYKDGNEKDERHPVYDEIKSKTDLVLPKSRTVSAASMHA